MKNLIDYIEECGEGCATPGNTMGMGNPMVPGDPGSPGMPGTPGTEPIKTIAGPKQEKKETSKKKKKTVTESILDDNLGEGLDEKIILDWFSKRSSSKIKVGKDLKVSAGYLSMYLDEDEPEIPNWIQFDNVKIFKLSIPFNGKRRVKEYKLSNIPTDCEKFVLDFYGIDKLIIDIPSLTVKQEMTVESDRDANFNELVLPKVYCPKIDLSRCSSLESLKCEKIDTTFVNLPRYYVGNIVKKELGLKDRAEVAMNGNSMQQY